MTHLLTSTSRKSQIFIENGIIGKITELIGANATLPRHIFVVSDANVAKIYLEPLLTCLRENGVTVDFAIIPAGEASKSIEYYSRIIEETALSHVCRSDAYFALGGGVVGDLTGFCAATYMRGIDWIYIPTSLLAMVDASVGGKTAINIPFGKNMIGAFHPPSMVLIDPKILSTLNSYEISNGMAEVIKTACLSGGISSLIESIEVGVNEDNMVAIIAQCLKYKISIVNKDEYDKGLRKYLNFGHTIGHAIEALSGYSIHHGFAVAIGMVGELTLAENCGMRTSKLRTRLIRLLQKYNLPSELPYYWKQMVSTMLNDKKNRSGKIIFAIPNDDFICNEIELTEEQILMNMDCYG